MVAICNNVLRHGACQTHHCPYSHDVWPCENCGVICNHHAAYKAHIRSQKHKMRVSKVRKDQEEASNLVLLRCTVCVRNISQAQWNQHAGGQSHRANVTRSGRPDVGPSQVDMPGKHYCAVCDAQIENYLWSRHSQTSFHQRKIRFAAYRAAEDEAGRDKNDVTVTGEYDFGIVEAGSGQYALTAKIETTVPSARIELLEAKFTRSASLNAVYPYVHCIDSCH